MIFESLGSEDLGCLEAPFFEEVFSTLSSLCKDKAPRLNGFSMAF